MPVQPAHPQGGGFVISLDFELMWGVRDRRGIADYGANILGARRAVPRLLDLYKGGRLKLDELVTATYSIDQAQQAFDDMVAGVNARGVIVF